MCLCLCIDWPGDHFWFDFVNLCLSGEGVEHANCCDLFLAVKLLLVGQKCKICLICKLKWRQICYQKMLRQFGRCSRYESVPERRVIERARARYAAHLIADADRLRK